MQRTMIVGLVFLSGLFLTGCANKNVNLSDYDTHYVYSPADEVYSKRVDYLGYGLGGRGFGGYGMGGYGLVGYGGQPPL